MGRLLNAGFIAAILLGATASEASAACDDMATAAGPRPTGTARVMTTRDIFALRDIGDPEPTMTGRPARITVSPDGKHIAFSLVRADLATNGYCQALYVASLAPGAVPRLVASGGDYRKANEQLRGFWSINGSMLPLIPAWSPDGRQLAYLRADNGKTAAWIAAVDGRGSRKITDVAGDVSAIAWSATGKLLYASSSTLPAERRAVDREADSGWLYDRRVFTSYDWRPLNALDQQHVVQSTAPDGSDNRPANPVEAALIDPDFGVGYPRPPVALAADGRRAWAENAGGGAQTSLILTTIDAAGRKTTCNQAWCRGGIYALWWDPRTPLLYVQRREGWRNETTAFYRWTPGRRNAERLFATTDNVQDCRWADAGFACTRENATTPRRIVLLTRDNGKLTEIFDPNPGFADFRLGKVTRLRARNNVGLESWADLVLPPDHRPGIKLPLVIVQYNSQGFLRGGTGNEYPIFPLVARGFAVLAFERPDFVAASSSALKTNTAVNAASLKGWSERRSALSSLLAELDLAIAGGAIDERRVGITGLSDGASTVRFAMINSKRFAVAAASTCCFDANSVMSASGVAFADYLRQMGFPPTTQHDPEFWRAYSLAVSGALTDTPLLLQLADHEAGSALETFQAMREYRKPIEMFVYPDEYHVKWQPIHKLAVADRAIDWFAFWLQGTEDRDPAKAAQYERWRALRAMRTPGATTQAQ